jgi:hypothetical protein
MAVMYGGSKPVIFIPLLLKLVVSKETAGL